MRFATLYSRAGLAQWEAILARSMGFTGKEVVSVRKKVENNVNYIVEQQRLFREMVEAADFASETSERGRIKVVCCFEAREPWKDAKAVVDDQVSPTSAQKK